MNSQQPVIKKSTKTQVNPIIIGVVVISSIFIILLVITLINLLRINPYGEEIKIDNLTSEYSNLPQNEQDLIGSELYNTVAKNTSTESKNSIPGSGAIIRDGSATSDYDVNTGTHSGSFIVDIPSIEQSYLIQFEWSPDKNSQGLGGYPVVVSCLPKDKQIYSTSLTCQDALSEKTVSWQNEYQINYSYGLTTATKIRKIIDKYFISSVTAESYTAVLDETSLTRQREEQDPTFSFTVALNDAATYAITARVDESYGEKYIVVYIKNISDNSYYAAIYTDEEKIPLIEWLQTISSQPNLEIYSASLQELIN